MNSPAEQKHPARTRTLNHAYVFKLKTQVSSASPSLTTAKEQVRRFAFTGDLADLAVFDGLYERTSQVFNLKKGSFVLSAVNGYPTSTPSLHKVSDFTSYLAQVVTPLRRNDSSALLIRKDEKQRIVLTFVVQTVSNPAAPPFVPSAVTSTSAAIKPRASLNLGTMQQAREALDPKAFKSTDRSPRNGHSSPSTLVSPAVSFPLSADTAPSARPAGPATSSSSSSRPGVASSSSQPRTTHSWTTPIKETPSSSTSSLGLSNSNLSKADESSEAFLENLFGYPVQPAPRVHSSSSSTRPLQFQSNDQGDMTNFKSYLDSIEDSEREKYMQAMLEREGKLEQTLARESSRIDSVSVKTAGTKEKRVLDLGQLKKERERVASGSAGAGGASNSCSSRFAPAANFHPRYSVDVPVQVEKEKEKSKEQEKMKKKEELVLLESEKEKVVVVPAKVERDALGGVKRMLEKFTNDFNQHMVDNFGAETLPLRLRLDDPIEEKVEEVKAVKKEENKLVVHQSCFCDKCLMTIVGNRYKCRDCSNYDLCSTCLTTRSGFHAQDHVFGTIATPGQPPIFPETVAAAPQAPEPVTVAVAVEQEAEVVHPADCNLCDQNIKGIRSKCLTCPDFDACQACYVSVSSVHPFHNFVPIYDPTLAINDLPDDLLSHHLVACDACDVCPIVGTRYKCVDRDCPDFDLCANCEADPVPRHPRNHLLLKIREPVPSAVARKKFQFVKNMMHAQAEAKKKAAAENEKGTSFGAKRQLIPGAGGDQTLVIDLDVSGLEGSEKLPSLIHVPVKLRAEGFTGPLVVSPQVVEKAKQEEKAVVPLLDEMEIAAAPAPIAKQYDATFIRDITLTDGSRVAVGSQFYKVWHVRNSGSQDWPVGTQLVHVGGFSGTSSVTVPAAKAGEDVEMSVELIAPEYDGKFMDHWRLRTPSGDLFGHRFWVDILVSSTDEKLCNSSSFLSHPSMTAGGKTAQASSSTHSPSPSVNPPLPVPAATAATSTAMSTPSVSSNAPSESISIIESESESGSESDLEEEEQSDGASGEQFVMLDESEYGSVGSVTDESDEDWD